METAILGTHVFTIIGIILIILEIVVPGFVMLPLGVAFLIAGGLTGIVSGTAPQLLILFVSLVSVFIFFSKVIRPKLQKSRFKSNVESLVGQKGIVEEEINSVTRTGYVKVYADSWKAIASNSQEVINVGETVVIEKIDGNKVIVRKDS